MLLFAVSCENLKIYRQKAGNNRMTTVKDDMTLQVLPRYDESTTTAN